jgi:hypothetical protein
VNTNTNAAERGTATAKAAWALYVISANGSMIGQIWVGVITVPFPANFPWWVRAIIVLPFAVVIDLGGVVTSAFADERQRLGEAATMWRLLSAGAITVGVAINIIGHHDVVYLAVVFGGLGIFAYCIWLGHSAARRRDALRAAGKLADTAPDYGFAQRRREPEVTRRASILAVEHGYSVHESLAVARQQLRAERRNAALAEHIEKHMRAGHEDPGMASIAVTTADVEAVAARVMELFDAEAWAQSINAQLVPPSVAEPVEQNPPAADEYHPTDVVMPPADVLRRVPTKQVEYDQWRQLWAELVAEPGVNNKAFAARHGISVRQVQWIRAVGAVRLLDSPIPPAARLVQLAQLAYVAQLAQSNGHAPLETVS